MVPETRIELVRVAPHAPQTCVSTISTTPALNAKKYIKTSPFRQVFSVRFFYFSFGFSKREARRDIDGLFGPEFGAAAVGPGYEVKAGVIAAGAQFFV